MPSVGDLTRLAASFARHLQAENKSKKTIEANGDGVQQLLAHLAAQSITSANAISREHVEDFIAKLLETRSAARANNRFRALQQFFKWLEAEDYVDVNPMAKMRPPAVPDHNRRSLNKPMAQSRPRRRRALSDAFEHYGAKNLTDIEVSNPARSVPSTPLREPSSNASAALAKPSRPMHERSPCRPQDSALLLEY